MSSHIQISTEEAEKEFLSELTAVLIDFLSTGTWAEIEETLARAKLEWRDDLEPGWGKPKYVTKVIGELSKEEIIALTIRLITLQKQPSVLFKTPYGGINPQVRPLFHKSPETGY